MGTESNGQRPSTASLVIQQLEADLGHPLSEGERQIISKLPDNPTEADLQGVEEELQRMTMDVFLDKAREALVNLQKRGVKFVPSLIE